MNKVAIAFLTKDRVELSRQTIRPLFAPHKFDIWWFDGSKTDEGANLPYDYPYGLDPKHVHFQVLGGADAAVLYALTTMLNSPEDYTHVGLCENDVLLPTGWFAPMMQLFERGKSEGLSVGAVSARAYEDRVLIQRDGYAIMHNLGFGHIILTRHAARLWLEHWRTGITTENRRLFMQLSGIDIGRYWAFRAAEHNTCSDWQLDRVLASYGLASLALTPTDVQMIGQEPPLHEQGLTLATQSVELLRDDAAFNTYRDRTQHIRDGEWRPACSRYLTDLQSGTTTILPHQIAGIGGVFTGDWKLRWAQGFGPFAWRAGDEATFPQIIIPVSGPVEVLVSGGESGGKALVEDTRSGYRAEPDLPAEGPQGQILSLPIPTQVSYREIRITARTPGVVFYGIKTREPQPYHPHVQFDHSFLPPV